MSVLMSRSEAVARVARADLAHVSADERRQTLESMHSEDWDTEAGWRALPSDLLEELASGHIEADPASSRYDAAILVELVYRYRGANNAYLIRRLNQLGVGPDSIAGEPALMEACPCCGHRTLDERGQYDVCVVCWWEDDGQDNQTADETRGGPNAGVSLSRARASFLAHGISDPARQDLRRHQQPADMFALARHFALAEEGAVVEEPATGWRSGRLHPSPRASELSENAPQRTTTLC